MKRTLMNLAALAVIVGGGSFLATSASAATAPIAGGCTAGNGATCSGDNCCANATTCWNNCP